MTIAVGFLTDGSLQSTGTESGRSCDTVSLELEIFVDGLDHPEGVAVHPDGSVWCGGEAGQIYRIDPGGQTVQEVAQTRGFVLGIAFSPDLKWLAICDIRRKAVLRLDLATMDLTVFAEAVSDWHFRIPNYPVFDRAGSLYVSESGDFGSVQRVRPNYGPEET